MRFYMVSKYLVVENEGEYICTCPDFLFRKRECKHIKAVKNGEVKEIEIV